MAKISTYPILSDPTINDILIGTDVEDSNITKNFSIGSIVDIVGGEFVPYVGATGNVNLGAFNITSSSFIVAGGLSSQFLKANGTLDSTVYVPATRTITINSVGYDLSANRSWDLNTINSLTTIGTSGAATYIGKTLNIPQYQAQGDYITQLNGEATAVGPGNATITLSNLAVISKVLTGLNITGGTISDTDSILTAFGKVQNQINGLAGGVTYEGTWNAATNTPTLTSSVGTQGHYYVVSVAGNTNLNGITDWQIGDWAIFNGSAWQKVDNTDAVVSVNGYTGAVVLTFSDVGAPPATRTLTINGVGYDLSADRSWTVGDVRTDQTYSNPTWISSLAWGKITGTPTTLAGYGITDGALNTRTLTINGTTYDLTANRTWNVGTVTSVGTSGPLTGGTITGSGTIGITQSGASSDGYLSSTDWNTFNNKQNALTNPVTGTGTIFTLPMWSGATSLVDSPLSYGPDAFNFQYNSATGGTVNFTNIGLTAYTYSIQMNNFGSPRSTIHSYTDGIVVQSIGGTQVSRVFANGNTILGAGAVDNGYKLEITGNLYVNSIANATTDTDRFIVSDGGIIKYRTGAQLLSDIGAQGALTLTTVGTSGPATLVGNTLNVPNYGGSLTGYVPYTGATQDVNLGEFGLTAGQLTLDVSPTGTAVVGTTRWNNSTGVSETTLKGGTVILKNGVDLVARVVNKVTPNATLTKAAYQAVRVSGAQGQRLAVAYAQANNDANSADTIGLVTETIPTNQEGFIMTVGQLEDINTTGSLQGETWNDGDVLYLSATIPGALTNIKPTAVVGHIVVIGYVEYAHAINGKIYVKIMNGWELDELHNVYINNPLNNQGLFYTSATQLWENKSIATALGYTPANAATTITINGTTYDLSANRTWNVGTVTGTGTTNFLPKFTGSTTIGDSVIADNATEVSINKRVFINNSVHSISFQPNNSGVSNRIESTNLPLEIITAGASLILAAGGASPQISLASTGVVTLSNLAGSGTRMVVANASGVLSTQSIAANQVTGTGTTNYLSKFTGSTTIGNSQVFDNGTNVGIGTGSTGGSRLNILNIASNPVLSIRSQNNVYEILTMTFDESTDLFSITNKQAYSLSGIAFGTNNTERVRITQPGNLLVNTSTDSGFRLDVNGTGRFSGTLTSDTFLRSNGGIMQIFEASSFRGGVYTYKNWIGSGSDYSMVFGSNAELNLIAGGGTTKQFTLTSGGNVGIGTSSPDSFFSAARNLVVGTGSGNNGMSIFSGSSAVGDIAFADATSDPAYYSGLIRYDHSLDAMRFFTASTERLRITSGGIVDITRVDRALGAELRITNAFSGSGWLPGDIVGTLNFVSNDSSTSQPIRSQIQAISRGGSTFPSLTNLTFSTSNGNTLTEGFRLTDLSNLLVGTTTDSGYKLDVNGTGRFKGASASPTLTLANSTGGTLADFTITENTGLIVNSYEGASARSIDFRVANTSALLIASSGAATFSSSVTANTFLRAASGAQSNPTGGASVAIDYQSTSDLQGRIRSRDWDGAAWRNLTIEANNIILSPAGNVGIGTASPAVKLNIVDSNPLVVGDSTGSFAVSYETGTTAIGQGGGIFLGIPASSGSFFSTYIKSARESADGANSAAALVFGTRVNGGSNTERMRITSGGNVGIGNGFTPSGALHIYGSTYSSSRIYLQRTSGAVGTYSLGVQSADNCFGIVDEGQGNLTRLFISNTGNVLIGTTTDNGFKLRVNGGSYLEGSVYSPYTYGNTSGGAANLGIAASGEFYRSTSSIKYKKNVQDYTRGLDDVMKLRPVTYKGISEMDSNKTFAGLIAEEVHELGLNEFVQYAEDGTPDALAYQNMIALAFKAIQELKSELDELKGNN